MATSDIDLGAIVEAIRDHPGLAAKKPLARISDSLPPRDWLTGPGDDGAAIAMGSDFAIVCGEAIFPPFVAHDPHGAGIAAVLANVNDVAAMGAEPLAIVDTIVADASTAEQVLAGMRWASEAYRVPIVGGHLTISDGPPSVSAFALGSTTRPLSATNVRQGQRLVIAASLDGRMRPDFPFFTSLDARRDHLAHDVRLLPEVAERGLAIAAKDISMAGLIGSLAMLFEFSDAGIELDVSQIPTPDGVPLAQWLTCFPSFGFLLACEESTVEGCLRIFHETGLTAHDLGTIDASGMVRLCQGDQTVDCLPVAGVTGLDRNSSIE